MLHSIIHGVVLDLDEQIETTKQEEIVQIVKESLKDGKSLSDTEEAVKLKFDGKLGNYDRIFIEDNYTKHLIECWNDEFFSKFKNLIAELSTSGNKADFIELIEALSNVSSFDGIFDFFDNLTHHSLISKLISCTKRLKQEEPLIVDRLKFKCLSEVKNQVSSLEDELELRKRFVDVLKLKDLKNIRALLQLDSFVNNEDTFTAFKSLLTLVLSIKHNDKSDPVATAVIHRLQGIVRRNSNKDNYFFARHLKSLIQSFLEPVQEQIKPNEDGRSVLELTGKHLVLSQILPEVESRASFSEIEEVRFVGAVVIHADWDLKAELWHGKNVVLVAEHLVVSKDSEIKWDVSGKSAENPNRPEPAGTGVDGYGLRGADGLDGESGGNVFCQVDMIENGENLTITSLGGRGSRGQDGGEGKDGSDGQGLSASTFTDCFPPVAKLSEAAKVQLLERNLTNIFRNIDIIEKVIIGSSELSVNAKMDKHSKYEWFKRKVWPFLNVKSLTDMYIEARTTEGHKITFSFCYEDFNLCQAYLLHEGSEGEEGKSGGAGGLSGKQGFSGDIEIPNHDHLRVKTICHEVGEVRNLDGRPGQPGKPGKKGPDSGYMDCSLYLWSSFPKLFSSNEDTKLTLHFQTDKSSDRVWCFKQNRYCMITKAKQTLKKSQKVQMKRNLGVKQNRREVQVQRKKCISKREMMEKYSIKAKDIDGMHNIEGILEEKLVDLQKQIQNEEIISTSFKVARHVSYSPMRQCSMSLPGTNRHTKVNVNNHQTMNVEVDKAPNLLQNVRKNVTNAQHFPESSEHFDIRKNLFDKLQLLGEINSTLENLPKMSEAALDCDQFDNRVFSAVQPQDSLTKVESLFIEDSSESRSEIVEECNQLLKDGKFPTDLLRVFIEEYQSRSNLFREAVGEEHAKTIRKLHKKVMKFETKRTKAANSKFFPLDELLRNHKSLQQDLFETISEKNNNCKVKFEIELSKNKLLSAMFRQFVKESKRQFDFETLLSNPSVKRNLMDAFKKFFMNVGPLSSCYREFIAIHFKTNILLHQSNHDLIKLKDNHNPQAHLKIHILLKENKFSLLRVDDKFHELIQHHEILGNFYNKILHDVDSLDEVEEHEQYNSTKSFLSKDYMKEADTLKVKTDSVKTKISQTLKQDEDIQFISNSFTMDKDKELLYFRLEKLKDEFMGCEAILNHIAKRFYVEGNMMSVRELCYIIDCTVELALEDSKTSKLITWIIASYHQMDWIIEIAIVRIEYIFKQMLGSALKREWKVYLNNLKTEKEKLLFLLEHIGDESTFGLSTECFEEILVLFSSTPKAHIGLENIGIGKWKYYLKEKFFSNKIDMIAEWSSNQKKEMMYFITSLENKLGDKVCEKILDNFSQKTNEISCEEDKHRMIRTLKILTSCDQSFCEKVLEKLSCNKIYDWEAVAEKECCNEGKERSYDDLIKLIKLSGNTSQDILNKLQDMKHSIENWVNLTSAVSSETSSSSNIESTKNNVLDRYRSITGVVKNCKSVSQLFDPDVWKKSKSHVKLKQTVKTMVEMSFKITENSGNSQVQTEIIDTIVKFIEKDNNYYDEMFKFLKTKQLHPVVFVPFVAKVIEQKLNKRLRNTQIISIVTMLLNTNNTLAQVSTGEGKSLIVVVLSIIKALLSNKVNVITSSTVLAKRDAVAYKKVFQFFGIGVGHNCSEDLEERKKVYSSCQVVYGELGNFQRDYLLDRIYNKNIRGDCTFDVVIVDEVDSMLLDKGNNVLYLAHDIPGLDNLESIFIHIWKWLNNSKKKEGVDPLTDLAILKENIIFDIFGLVKKEYLENFVDSNCQQVVTNTWNYLTKQEVIDLEGKVLVDSMIKFKHKVGSLPRKCLPIHHLNFIFEQVFSRERSLNIPNYLRPFVEKHLDNWIQSGVNALMMQSERDYVVDVDRSETASERNPNIILLDPSTGTDLPHSQWDEGLHQFLQLKHGCKLSLVSLKAVFVSNVSYLKLYNTMYGLTGTLGSQQERDMLQDTYKKEDRKLDFVTIPTAKFKRFKEDLPILCSNEDCWGRSISEEACKIVKTRSVLIICESVSDVIGLKDYFPSNINVHMYTRDYEELKVAENLEPGQVIIATNLAGRGTDITISKALEEAGGLHVCLTYLPSNCRIEEQAYGRVARNGQPGTAQMILKVSSHHLIDKGISTFIDLKKQRDEDEADRLAEIKDHYSTQIMPEEYWLDRFKTLHEKLRTNPMDNFFEFTNSAPSSTSCEVSMESSPFDAVLEDLTDPWKSLEDEKEQVKLVLVETCLNEWAFWLDRNSSFFSSNANKEELESSFSQLSSTWETFCGEDFHKSLDQIKDPYQLIKLGILYLGKRNSLSIKLFDQVIEREPGLSDIALYYKVCAKTMDKDLRPSDIIGDLETVASKLKKKIHSSAVASHLIDWIKEHNPQSILQIDAFKNQQFDISNIYNLFLQSINDVIGHEISPESFNLPDDNKYALKLFNDLIKKGAIESPKIKTTMEEKDLKFAWNYMISPQKMLQLLGPLKGEEFSETKIKEAFKTVLPSRELFWEEMKQIQCFVDEEKLVWVCIQELESLDPSLVQKLDGLTNEQILNPEQHNILYLYDYDNQFKENEVKVVQESKLVDVIGYEKFEFLKRANAIFINKRAKFCTPDSKITFSYFDSICEANFTDIGIHSKVARAIIREMVSLKIIKPCKNGTFSLETQSENIECLSLPKHKPYIQVVKSMMELCFSFRIALEKIKLLSEVCDCIPLPLQGSLHKNIILDLDENNIITKTCVVKNKDVEQILSKLYPSSMSRSEYAELFVDQYGEKRYDIVEELIQNEWLICNQLRIVQIFNKKYYINPTIFEKDNQVLDGKFNNESKTIAAVLLSQQELIKMLNDKKNMKSVLKTLERLKGIIYAIDTPKLSLKPLLYVLKKSNLPVSELSRFSLNGYDKLLCLEEKKWTWRMFRNTFVVAVFGLAQVFVGLTLGGLLSPLGAYVVAQGVSDLVFAGTCMVTGHCNWKSYKQHKIFSLIFGTAAGLSKVESFLGRNIMSEISFQQIKNFILEATLQTKVAGKFVLSTVFKTRAMDLAQSVAIHTVKTMERRMTSGTYHTQIDLLGDFVTDAIFSIIDKIIDQHEAVNKVSQIFQRLCPTFSRELSLGSFNRCVKSHSNELERTFKNVTELLKTTIDQTMNRQQELNSGRALNNNLLNVMSKTKQAIKECFEKNMYRFTIVVNAMDDVDNCLHASIQDQNVRNLRYSDPNREKQDEFQKEITEIWKKEMKELFAGKLKNEVISPVLTYTANGLLTRSSLNSLPKWKNYEEKVEADRLEKLHDYYCNIEQIGIHDTKRTSQNRDVDSQIYSKNLLKLFKRNPSVTIFAEILQNNFEVDIYFLNIFSSLVPTALTKEGIDTPDFQLVLERNGTKQRFPNGNLENDTPTVVISSHADQSTNGNNVLITDVFEAIYNQLLEPLSVSKATSPQTLRQSVIKAIENDSSIQNLITCHSKQEVFVQESNIMNSSAEKSLPYQNFHMDGQWKYNPMVDVDLRDEKKSAILDCISKGFKTALGKINNKIQTHTKKPFKLCLEDFFQSNYHLAIQRNKTSTSNFTTFASHYELVVPLPAQKAEGTKLEMFRCLMILENSAKIGRPSQPFGPHIKYEVEPEDRKLLEVGVRGFILLPFECKREMFSAKECHAVGELIPPTPQAIDPKSKESKSSYFSAKECHAVGELIPPTPQAIDPKSKESKSSYFRWAVNIKEKMLKPFSQHSSITSEKNNYLEEKSFIDSID